MHEFHAPGHANWYSCDGELNRGCFEPACKDAPKGARYEFPLPLVRHAPVPSKANYKPKNVAWLIEFFANILGRSHLEIGFRYENNTPHDRCRPLSESDDIFVTHPGDKLYLPEKSKCRFKSREQKHYEKFAKKSKLLKLYERYSPAQIKFFNPLCPVVVKPVTSP